MQQSLAEEFKRTAAAAEAAFPDKLGNLVVFLAPSRGKAVYVSPQIADELSNNVAEVKKTFEFIEEGMRRMGVAGLAPPLYPIGNVGIGMVAMLKEQSGFYSPGNTKEMWSLFVLDHELGHRLLRNGTYRNASSPQHAESAADAYAMLRHIQRYGKVTKFAESYGPRRSKLLVLYGDTNHYSKFTMDKVIETSRERDICGLSLQETAELASQIADDTRLDKQFLEKLENAYRPVARVYEKHTGGPKILRPKFPKKDPEAYDLICREPLAVMRDHGDDQDILALGKEFLTSFPSIRKFMQQGAKTDRYWQEALAFIDPPAKPLLRKALVHKL